MSTDNRTTETAPSTPHGEQDDSRLYVRPETAAPMSPDALDDARHSCLEILRCYFHPDRAERARWWGQDYGGWPSAELALQMIQKELLG